jgi:hypothetical protein
MRITGVRATYPNSFPMLDHRQIFGFVSSIDPKEMIVTRLLGVEMSLKLQRLLK